MSEKSSHECPGCKSKGFAASVLGPDRCSFCDGTEGGHPPTAQEIMESPHAKGPAVLPLRGSIVERVVRSDGVAVRRIYGTIMFEMEEDDQRCGDVTISVNDGAGLYQLPPVYNFYDTLNEIARREPTDAAELAQLLARVNESPEASSRTYQAAYDAHMERVAPGWQGLAERAKPSGRERREPEHTKSAAKLEDLDL